ncbi:MAG: hypothetical protein WCO33_00355 [bacterium]
MDNTNKKDDKDKLRVITAEEVLEELRRRKKQYGSVYLPSNSYQVIKKPIINSSNEDMKSQKLPVSEQEVDNSTKNSNNKKNDPSLRKAVLFLESFAFKKPLQSVFTVLMILGITTGMYVATRPVGELNNINKADSIDSSTFIKLLKTDGSDYNLPGYPIIRCLPQDVDKSYCSSNTCTSGTADIPPQACLANSIYTGNISKLVILEKPNFLNFTLDSVSGKINLSSTRALTSSDNEKSYSIKFLGIPKDQSSFRLLSFTLAISSKTAPSSVADIAVDAIMRNPIFSTTPGNCEAAAPSGAKSKWHNYMTDSACFSAGDANPVIVTDSEISLNYDRQCHNNVSAKTVSFDVSANDKDGDVTAFEVSSGGTTSNNPRMSENLESYVQKVMTEVDSPSAISGTTGFVNYTYKNSVKLDIQESDIGTTIPVVLNAYNIGSASHRTSKTINVKVNEALSGASTNLSATVYTPKASDTVKGATTISWKIADGCDLTRYKIELWDKYCTTYKSKIVDETLINATSVNTDWDTRNTADGEYCVRVFVRNTLNDPFKVGSSGTITVQNNSNANHSPTIISNPTNTNIKVGEVFSYTVKTADQDSDAVSIVVNKKPDWLTLNGSTLSGSTTTSGKYDVSITAKDSKGALSAPQMFSVTFSPSDNTPSVITFDAFPTGNTITGTYVFKWAATDSNGIKSMTLNISSDGSTWTKLADLKATDKSFSFDSTKYKSGEYYIKLVVTDNKNDVVEKLSDKIVIQNADTIGTVSVVSHTPATGESITVVRPNITVKLALPAGKTLDETKLAITLDERVVTTLCKYASPDITCTLDKDLALGSHKVNVEYYDNTGVKAVETWEFVISSDTSSSVTSSASSVSQDPNTITVFGRSISKALGILLLVLCVAGLLIFVIPLIIFRVWKKKDSGGDDSPKPPVPSPTKVTPTNAVASGTNNTPYTSPKVETKYEPAFSYNTKKEFDVNKTMPASAPVTPVNEVRKHNVVTSIPVTNTPTGSGNSTNTNSSFPNPNKYANLPQSSTEVKKDSDLSEPNNTWGLAGRFKQNDVTTKQDNGSAGV